MARVKQPQDYVKITEEYDFLCTKCKTRHPKQVAKCFVCGTSDAITFDKVKVKSKKKSSARGATIKINL